MRPDQIRNWAREERQRSEDRARAKREIADLTKHRAKVQAELLTRHPIWDEYLQQISELQDKDQKELAARVAQMESENYLTDEDVARNRHEIAILHARIGARDQCLRIPKAALEADRDA